ncbi:hypothetical protein BJ138DRAFT_1108783 [Hygrophoropsis aurantiaca]|uniref:Uncharacterized protein n=1 Tax=Hygrophoropsis aurantiaca TaxID=72124 RepID=A0ACB8ATR6_9AGAM|nr:hypothetical protein BJ138DRAFT_1108783 [Hygrophoropsis aurantiaca]
MPARTYTSSSVQTYYSALAIPAHVWETMKLYPSTSNIILPYAEKALRAEASGTALSGRNLWITYARPGQQVEFVLSCTEGALGTYPIFIFTSIPITQIEEAYLEHPIYLLAKTLLDVVGLERVFSVFAVEPVTLKFAAVWSELTGINTYAEPYYDATFSYCTKKSFVNRTTTIHPDLIFELCLATPDDTEAVARLCRNFAATSEPFILSPEKALLEAQLLIQKQQVWIHRISRVGEEPDIASMVATTRQSTDVAAITKVYSNPEWRKLGCAERLVRRVCRDLLSKNERVVLYVGRGNPAAKVYHRVGFLGLDQANSNIEGVEQWLEIGFDRSRVQLGHW